MNTLGPQPVSGDADYPIVLVDLNGQPGVFASNATKWAKVFATTGPRNAPLFEPTVVWTTSSAGAATVSVNAADMQGVPAGQYVLEAGAVDSAGRTVAGYQALLTLSDGAMPDGFAPVVPGTTSSGLTVLALEEELVTTMGNWLAEVFGTAALQVTGKNPYLRWPVRESLLYLGILPANPLLIADADVAQVPPASVSRFLNLVRCFVVEECYANYTKTDNLGTNLNVFYDKVAQRMLTYLKMLRSRAGLLGPAYDVARMSDAGCRRGFTDGAGNTLQAPRGLPYRWSSLDCPGVYSGYPMPYSFQGYF